MNTTPRQNSSEIETLIADAARVMPALAGLLDAVAAETSSVALMGPLKSKASIARKVAADYAGDASRVVDICRGSLVCESNPYALIEAIARRGRIVRLKDRFAAPVMGYRDACLTVEIDGHLCEVQVHIRQIIEVKEILHLAYEYHRVTPCPVAAAWMEIAFDHAYAGLL